MAASLPLSSVLRVPLVLLLLCLAAGVAAAPRCDQPALKKSLASQGLGGPAAQEVLQCYESGDLKALAAATLLRPSVDATEPGQMDHAAARVFAFYAARNRAASMAKTFQVAVRAAEKGWEGIEDTLLRLGVARSKDQRANRLAFTLQQVRMWMRQRRTGLVTRRLRKAWMDKDDMFDETHADQLAVIFSQAAMRSPHLLQEYIDSTATLDAMAEKFADNYAVHHNRGLFHLTNYRWFKGALGRCGEDPATEEERRHARVDRGFYFYFCFSLTSVSLSLSLSPPPPTLILPHSQAATTCCRPCAKICRNGRPPACIPRLPRQSDIPSTLHRTSAATTPGGCWTGASCRSRTAARA